jgi:hypothetical protein
VGQLINHPLSPLLLIDMNWWFLLCEWYQSLPVVRKLRERRLISTTIVVSLLMILVAQLISTSSDHKKSPHEAVINWCCGCLYSLFAGLVLLLIAASPSNCTFSTLNLLVCLVLALVEFLVGGLALNDDGAFVIRLVGYILLACLELISSTKFKEWTLFGLFISFGVDFIAWVVLIPLQQHDMRAVSLNTSLAHFFISLGLAMAVWINMARVPLLSGQRMAQREHLMSAVGSKGFRYDDAIYAVSTAWNEFESGFESQQFIAAATQGGGGRVGEERSSLSSYLGNESVEEDDVEIMSLKLSEPTNPFIPRVMIALHGAVAIVALLMGQGQLSRDVGQTILAVLVNSSLCIWQVLCPFHSSARCLSPSADLQDVRVVSDLLRDHLLEARETPAQGAEGCPPHSQHSLRGAQVAHELHPRCESPELCRQGALPLPAVA